MLPHAVLSVRDAHDSTLGIPVLNFPVLPIGSSVYLYLSNTISIENAVITGYEVDNRRGTMVRIDLGGKDTPDEIIDRDWGKIAAQCIKDNSGFFLLIFPDRIDFGNKFPLPTDL